MPDRPVCLPLVCLSLLSASVLNGPFRLTPMLGICPSYRKGGQADNFHRLFYYWMRSGLWEAGLRDCNKSSDFLTKKR